MIPHQHEAVNVHLTTQAGFTQFVQIDGVINLFEEAHLAVVPSLDEMNRRARQKRSGSAGHEVVTGAVFRLSHQPSSNLRNPPIFEKSKYSDFFDSLL